MMMIYEVRSKQNPTETKKGYSSPWGAFDTRLQAVEQLDSLPEDLKARWDEWWIEEIDQTGMFVIPPKFDWVRRHEMYVVEAEKVESAPGRWNKLKVEVVKRGGKGEVVATYDRNYMNLYSTFEPFQQDGHHYALISHDYGKSSVLDLESGEVIASEPDMPFITGREPGTEKGGEHGWRHEGFCPVGFYVPDWWDVHDGSIQPGSYFWDRRDNEQPSGQYGFVWGCQWGDDSSWKVQHLDLSRITEGIITRTAPWGYLELDTKGTDPRDFITMWDDDGVKFSVPKYFKMTGEAMYE